jgi:hypothetical protein
LFSDEKIYAGRFWTFATILAKGPRLPYHQLHRDRKRLVAIATITTL